MFSTSLRYLKEKLRTKMIASKTPISIEYVIVVEDPMNASGSDGIPGRLLKRSSLLNHYIRI